MTEDSDDIIETSSKIQQPSIDEFTKHVSKFKILDEFVHYDFPRVFSALSRKKEYWLFKWLNRSKEKDNPDVWLAFQISEVRLNSLREGTTSLREAISLARGNLYAYHAQDPFEPTKAWIAKYDEIPPKCLPITDVSFKTGLTRDITNRKQDQLGVRLHILTEEYTTLKNTKLPATFQEYISSTAHKVEADSRKDEMHLRPDYPERDWSGLEITRIGLGSFDLECVSNDGF